MNGVADVTLEYASSAFGAAGDLQCRRRTARGSTCAPPSSRGRGGTGDERRRAPAPGGGASMRVAHRATERQGRRLRILKRCHPCVIAPQWTRERVREAMRAWQARYGAAPSSYDWSRTHARRRGGEALKRLHAAEWPAPSTVTDLYGAWAAARADAFGGA